MTFRGYCEDIGEQKKGRYSFASRALSKIENEIMSNVTMGRVFFPSLKKRISSRSSSMCLSAHFRAGGSRI